jgi:predicted transcriptional regulator
MYDMYKNSISVGKIARELDRSQGCVYKHIERLMEENNEERTS